MRLAEINFDQLHGLHDLGFALHWLKPRSKAPVNSGWTTGPRLSWDEFKGKYHKGYNVGVRLGTPSNIVGLGYLAAIDVDVKDPRYETEAHTALKKIMPEIEIAPMVLSGRGGGSCHYYGVLREPIKGQRLTASNEYVKVKMPSVAPSARERKQLTSEEVAAGYRLRAAWEITVMSEGRQIVLPGSVHPDSGRLYTWAAGDPPDLWDLPILNPPKPQSTASKTDEVSGIPDTSKKRGKIEFTEVDLKSLGLRPDQVAAIDTGEGVEDRSAEMFSLCMALLQRKVSDDVILSVFTDQRFFLGQTAYDHARTNNRDVAARWVANYTLKKAKKQVEDTDYQGVAIEFESGGQWQELLDYQPGMRGAPPILRPTFNNVKLLLENEVSARLIKRNLFTHDDTWTVSTPWGYEAGRKRSGNTDDALQVKMWLIHTYRLEVSISVVDEVLTSIAITNGYHPVKDFLEGLEWDGVSRVERAFETYLGADMPLAYLRPVCRKFFLALIARIYNPGCKFDFLPVLEGKQGTGKSSFGRILVGDAWFIDGLPDFADKDAALYLQGTWLCELAELSSIYRSTKEAAKAFIARSSDKIRPPYGHRRVDYPRSCIFIGTTNETDYLTDNTGNRRFWPVAIHGCDFDALARDREQLLAEAKFLWDYCREPLYLQGKALEIAQHIQEDRRAHDDGDAMQMSFNKWRKDNADRTEIHLYEMFDGPFYGFNRTMLNYRNAAMVLRRAGFIKSHTRKGKVWVKEES